MNRGGQAWSAPFFVSCREPENQYFRATTSYSTPTPLHMLFLSKFTRVGNNMEGITL